MTALSPTLSTAPPRSPPEVLAHQDPPVRVFVALFDYDPVSMSPNPDAGEEELPFREGQILKVIDSLSGPRTPDSGQLSASCLLPPLEAS